MKKMKSTILTLSLLVSAFSINAQESPRKDPAKKWKNHGTATKKWTDGKLNKNSDSGQYLQAAYFQDRRAKKWTVGLMLGVTYLNGDADKKQLGYDIAPFIKYSISQTLALRAEYNFAMLRGQRDLQNPTLFKDNFRFRSEVQDWNIQMHFTIGNISFLRPLRKTQMYLFAGVGQASFRSKAYFTDQRLFLGDYYLTSYFGQGSPNPNLGKEVTEKYQGRHLIIPGGIGFKTYLTKRFDLGLEYRHTWLRSDDIDVYNTAIWQNRWWDSYDFIRASIGYKFGSKNPQHYDWLSPVESIYDQMADVKKKTDCLGKDDDNDHVSNCFDQENDTPDSCMVYGNGMAVDTDRDGIPDCKDKEITEYGASVDGNGVAVDSDGDGVSDFRDRELNSSPGAVVDNNGIEIKTCCNCDNVMFPSITISKNCLTNETKMILYQVADKMKQCPDKKIIINGPAGKSSKYNASGNTKCMDEIIKFITEKFGISRDRIITNYSGGTETKNTIEIKIQ
ncbi:MAG: hypothetical protein V4613_04445 [Bacteroidota bacterium]